MTKENFTRKYSLKSLVKKDINRLDAFLSASYSSGQDYRILEFENNSELVVLNKNLYKDIRAMARFLVSNVETVSVERVKKICFINQTAK